MTSFRGRFGRRWAPPFFRGGILVAALILSFQPAFAQTNPTARAGVEAQPVYVYDLWTVLNFRWADPSSPQAMRVYETAHAVSCIQGIVNRRTPRLYVMHTAADRYWLEMMRAPGGWMRNRPLVPIYSVEGLIEVFGEDIRGVVLWDPDIPATSNLASTVAGVENLIPIPDDESPYSLFSRLVLSGPNLDIVVNLTRLFRGTGKIPDTDLDSTRSLKNDAYLWGMERYIRKGLVDSGSLVYNCDAFWIWNNRVHAANHNLTNHDYFVSRKSFFVDLSPWGDEIPVDDPGQTPGTDRETLEIILRSLYRSNQGNRMVQAGVCIPVDVKYTDLSRGKHSAEDTEKELMRLFSEYNIYSEMDGLEPGYLANASFFQHFPMQQRYSQNRPPTIQELRNRGYIRFDREVVPRTYVMFYNGDYTGAAWLAGRMNVYWDDPARGTVPISWGVNPAISRRHPFALDFFLRTVASGDTLVAAPSGAGFVFPDALLSPRQSDLPSADRLWQDHCKTHYRSLDFRMTALSMAAGDGIANSTAQSLFLPFSRAGLGVLTDEIPMRAPHMAQGVPVFPIGRTLPDDPWEAAEYIDQHADSGSTRFLAFRGVMKSPSFFARIGEILREDRPETDYAVVDAYTFSSLIQLHLRGYNKFQAAYVRDTIPGEVQVGQAVPARITIRNDGWEMWRREGFALRVQIREPNGNMGVRRNHDLTEMVEPGMEIVFPVTINAPRESGIYTIVYEMISPEGPFSRFGDLPWETALKVTR